MDENFQEYGHKLVTWYRQNRRDLPWRRTCDVYAIWVSETMLQQTRVETVIPYYLRFLSAFPGVADLAKASEEQVLKHWQGLGYYRRAKNLHLAAKQVCQEWGGDFPKTRDGWLQLAGVGDYTAGAVLSIAMGQPEPAIDGNVLRVMSRLLCIREPVRNTNVVRRIRKLLEYWLTNDVPSDVTQSIMELGAIVCTPRSPQCLLCPLAEGCRAKREGCAAELPVKVAKAARKKMLVSALWLEHAGQLLIEQRPEDGLLGGMWQLPSLSEERTEDGGSELPSALRLAESLMERLVAGSLLADEISESPQPYLVPVATEKHVFTHLEWEVHVCRPVGLALEKLFGQSQKRMERMIWVPVEDWDKYAWPRVYEKILEKLLSERVNI